MAQVTESPKMTAGGWIVLLVFAIIVVVFFKTCFFNGAQANTELTHAKRIDNLFSYYDGSNAAVVGWIKQNIKDPGSYKHIETKYRDDDSVVTVITKFSATNSFNAREQTECIAVIDTTGTLITAKFEEQ